MFDIKVNPTNKIADYIGKLVFPFLMLYFAFYLFFAIFSLSYPYQIDYGEGFLLNQAKMLSEGKNIYKDISEMPFIISNYPPLYPLIWSFFVRFLGVSFFGGRLISIFSCLLTSIIIYKLVLKNTGDRKVAIISGLIFLASPYVYFWGVLARVDFLGLFLSLFGIYLILEKQKSGVFLSIPVFVASIFTKQSFIVAPISAFIYLLFRKERKLALKFGSYLLIPSLALFSFLNCITENQFFYHVLLYNANPFSLYLAISSYISFLWKHWGILLLSLYFLTTEKNDGKTLLKIYFFLSSLFAFTVGKVGSSVNYFLEVIAVSSMLSGFSVHRIMESENEQIKKFLNLILILQMVSFAHAPFVHPSEPSFHDLEANRIISEQIKGMNKLLSEDGGILVINGKEIYFQPFEFTQLAIQGMWDDENIVKEIRKRSFEAIILEFSIDCMDKSVHYERFTPKIVESIKDNYYLSHRIGKFFIYLPKPE